MAGQHRRGRGGVDDWFAEPEPEKSRVRPRVPLPVDPEAPTLERHEDDWLGSGDSVRRRRRRFGATTQDPNRRLLLVAGVIALTLLIALVVGHVSSGSLARPKPAVPRRTTPPPAVRSKVAAIALPTTTLKLGDHGLQVKRLQRALTTLGYSTGGIDGQYGPGTKRALMSFQQANHLSADGTLGPATLGALAHALRQRG